jgi:hypothetical protein
MFNALSCPQCGGALPRQALWRVVACPYCSAQVTRSEEVVQRATFRAALQRSQAQARDGVRVVGVAGRHYRLLTQLGEGDHASAWLAELCGPLLARVTLKIAREPVSALPAEAHVLQQLQALQGAGSAYFSQRLPQLLASGRTDEPGHDRDALVLRHPTGFWGSLADAMRFHPDGLRDPRHAVWLWRRVLEVLAYVHRAGWVHNDLRPTHWLVHPADHGVLLIGWGTARRGGDPATDLMQSAWAVRCALAAEGDSQPAIPSRVPAPLAQLLEAASEDRAWCSRLDAEQLDQHLQAAAREAFGPPRFIPFNPQHA